MIEMQADVAQELRDRLKRDYKFVEEHSQTGGAWLRKGVCPSCNSKELYAKADQPWMIRCGRLNNCGYEERTKAIYPDAFGQFNKRYPATEKDPLATAKAYLRMSRGFDLEKIEGWYTQGGFFHAHADKGTATVRFSYGPPEAGLYMERLIEEVTITDPKTGERKKRKAHFHGDYKGLCWEPPGLEIEDGDEVWIAEGVIKAIALNLNGVKAVSSLSAYNYPDLFLEDHKGKKVRWVWAQDNDPAGRKFTRKYVRRMREEGFADVTAAQVPLRMGKVDWDDLHLAGRLTPKDLEEYRYYGKLLIAESAADKAILMYKHKERRAFPFEFNNRMYWFEYDDKAYEKALRALDEPSAKDDGEELTDEARRDKALYESKSITEIANCAFQALYFQRNLITDESWYYFRVTFPHQGKAVKGTFNAAQISSTSEFKKRLLSVAAGAVWTGKAYQLDWLWKDQLYHLKTVDTVDYIGYSKDHGTYIYNQIAVQAGKLVTLNSEDYFDLGQLSIKTLQKSVALQISTEREKFRVDWVEKLVTCYGPKGVIALAWWLGSLFAEQIRAEYGFYPFIEIIGEPGAGKSTLIEFMWKLVGRNDYEGFDPSKSSAVAVSRSFAQVSNLPICLIEGDRDEDTPKYKRFDFDTVKTAYNGRAIRATGAKNGGTDTYEPLFRGALCISQNEAVIASQPVQERIIHLRVTREGHTPATKAVADELKKMKIDQLSQFLLAAITSEAKVLETVKRRKPAYEDELLENPDVKTMRIAENHAIMKGLVEALADLVPLPNAAKVDALDMLTDCAVERQKRIASDHPVVEEFWEAYEYLNALGETGQKLNHSKSRETIAVNLKEFEALAGHMRLKIPEPRDLKRHLKNSRSRKYLGNRPVNSAIRSTQHQAVTVRCWVFENPNHTERS